MTSSVYQVAGLDDRERGFNRQASVRSSGEGFHIQLRYESVQVTIGPVQTEEVAIMELIQELQGRGYRQLRLQRLFEGERYLGSQDIWRDFPDPPLPQRPTSWLARLRQYFRQR